MTQDAASYEPLHRRPHTFLGVCEAIGEDFGFAPEWLRLAFGVGLFFNPVVTLATYFGLGLLVLAARKLAPNPIAQEARALERARAMAEAEQEAATIEPANEQVPVALAA